MKALFILTIPFLILVHKVNAAQSVEPSYIGHPIVGTWVRNKNSCLAEFTFTASGLRLVRANEEIVKARYQIEDISREKGIYLLTDTVLEDNGLPDCSNSTSDMTGDTVEVILFIKENPTRFNFCFDSQLTHCVGPYIRQD